ncbi:MAG: carboxymuconolactone decarboxylase family protein [Granulosicoccus sp.]
MSRINPPRPPNLTEAQQAVHDAIVSGPRGAVVGPLGVWLWRPDLAQRAQTLGQYCRFDSCLPTRLSELAILITGRYWGSEFEWQHHKPIALDAGLDKDIVEAIRKGETPVFKNKDEHCVYDLAMSLYKTRRVPDAIYQEAIEILGQDAVIDLVAVLGYYAFISMTINVFEVDAEGENELS